MMPPLPPGVQPTPPPVGLQDPNQNPGAIPGSAPMPPPGTGTPPVPSPDDEVGGAGQILDPLEEDEITTINPEPLGNMKLPRQKKPNQARDKCPPWLKQKDKRIKLGRDIVQALQAGRMQKGDLPERIKRNEALFENKNLPPSRLPWVGAQFYHFGLVSPRILQRKTAFVSTVCGQEVIFRFQDTGRQDRVEAVEKCVQWHLNATHFQYRLDEMAQIAYVTNGAIWRVTFQNHPEGYEGSTLTGPFASVVYDVIHPDYFVIWPAGSGGIENSRLSCHCWEEMASDVKVKQKSGQWFNETEIAGGDKRLRDRPEDLQTPNSDTGDIEDRNVVIWDGIWRQDLDGDGIVERYRVIFHEATAQVLMIEPYTSAFTHYVAMPIKRETGNFWTEGSVAQDLQGLQVFINGLMNEFSWGIQMSSRPPIISEGAMSGDSFKSYKPGEMRTVRSLKQAMPIPTNFNGQYFPIIMNFVKEFADSVSKVSDTLTGAPSTGDASTATEQNIKYQGFQLSGSDDVKAMAPGLIHVGRLTLMLLADNFDVWYPLYGQEMEGIESAEDLQRPLLIKLASTDPQDAPQMELQQAQLLLQLATTFPQSGLPVAELIRMIVNATNLPDKEDLLRAIDQAAGQMGMIQNAGQLAQILHPMMQNGQQPPSGGPGPQSLPHGPSPTAPRNQPPQLGPLLQVLRNARAAGVPGPPAGGPQ